MTVEDWARQRSIRWIGMGHASRSQDDRQVSVAAPRRPDEPHRPDESAARPQPQNTSTSKGDSELLPYSRFRRAAYGSWWTFRAVLFVLCICVSLAGGAAGAALLALALGSLAGHYAYRIWAWQARSLWFVIFF